MTKTSQKTKQEVVSEHQHHETDTGSIEVQIALLTERINHLVEHLKLNKKDKHTQRGLLVMVGRRKRFIKYMKRRQPEVLKKLAKKLKIKVKDN